MMKITKDLESDKIWQMEVFVCCVVLSDSGFEGRECLTFQDFWMH